jgi:hypothetical protein
VTAIPDGDGHDRAARVLVPNALLPVQYFDRIRRRKLLTGERRLMLAVLEQAVEEYLRRSRSVDRRGRRLFAETAQWFQSADRSHLYCFPNVCDHLGLEAEYLRQQLRRCGPEGRPASPASATAVAGTAVA